MGVLRGRLRFATLLVACLTLHLAPCADQDHGKVLIERAKRTPVVEIDKELPSQRLENWLSGLCQGAGKLTWEVNDCGEQTGDPATDRERDLPICVEATITLANGRRAGIVLGSATQRNGPRDPTLRTVYVIPPKSSRVRSLDRLHDLPGQLCPPESNN